MKEKLTLRYDKRMNDFRIVFPEGQDGHLLFYHLLSDKLQYGEDKKNNTPYTKYNFAEDLESRGYDLTTLKFSIEKKK